MMRANPNPKRSRKYSLHTFCSLFSIQSVARSRPSCRAHALGENKRVAFPLGPTDTLVDGRSITTIVA